MVQTGLCVRGDRCPYAHNVFEYWLHPTRYAHPPSVYTLTSSNVSPCTHTLTLAENLPSLLCSPQAQRCFRQAQDLSLASSFQEFCHARRACQAAHALHSGLLCESTSLMPAMCHTGTAASCAMTGPSAGARCASLRTPSTSCGCPPPSPSWLPTCSWDPPRQRLQSRRCEPYKCPCVVQLRVESRKCLQWLGHAASCCCREVSPINLMRRVMRAMVALLSKT